MKEPFFDSAKCGETFHCFQRTAKGIRPFHADERECESSEYYLPMSEVPDRRSSEAKD